MDIFISYSSKEYEKACMVSKVLNNNGISTWMAPGSIPAGSNYTREIPCAIRQCKVFLLLLSPNAQASKWVIAELETAFKNEKPIIPFVIENCVLKDEFDFMLSRCQRIEAYGKTAYALEMLVSRLKVLIGSTNMDRTASSQQERFMPPTGPYAPAPGRRIVTFTYPDGVYVGEEFGVLTPQKGKFTWNNGDVYEGDFTTARTRTGKGRYIWISGNIYEGDVVNGMRTGMGKFVWANGDVYEGDFVDNKRTGKGKLTYSRGEYVGDFVDGKWHGYGVFRGEELVHCVRNGQRQDYYEWHEKNGKWVEGTFYEGTVSDKDGTVIRRYKDGVWVFG